MAKLKTDFYQSLATFATELTGKFKLGKTINFSPEDQLKGPVSALIKDAGKALGYDVNAVTEVQAHQVFGRPDIGISVKSLLAGHVELKAPGKGADTGKLKGTDKEQWERFKDLPNLLYCDGNEWALYRGGERIGKLVRISGDVTADGKNAAEDADAETLLNLLRDFFSWEPITPTTPHALAEMIAPLCRLLRSDVILALEDPSSNLNLLANEWRKYLFPDADNPQFADAYAQTFTYALLLARLSDASDLSIPKAVQALQTGHRLLSDALKILNDDRARKEIEVSVSMLERVIAAIDVKALAKKTKGEVWLYFYEYFLAAYDPKMRKDRGVYYTPVEVVQAQVRLISLLLVNKFDAASSFADPNVVTLDPAAGTGTYVLTALQHSLDQVATAKGHGMRATAATTAAKNLHAFELLVGPYAVAHLRVTQQILAEGGQLPTDGVHVFLTDTLQSPHEVPPQYPLVYKELGEEHKRAQKVKAKTPVLVCLGNPPYDRQQIYDTQQTVEKRKGGWVRYGDEGEGEAGILKDFIEPLHTLGLGLHAKNLYNDYVYFWRWALWKVFHEPCGGIVSFITASSYLRGPGFAGMRQVMRQTFDELWIIDLEGDSLGARKTENVFAIRTPVAIALGVRYDGPKPEIPASAHYSKIEGTQEEKLAALGQIEQFAALKWRDCLTGWTEPFLPKSDKPYWDWPLLTDIFPQQENGMQFKRSWPIAENVDVLQRRWNAFLIASDRKKAFKESRDREITKKYPSLDDPLAKLVPLCDLKAGASLPKVGRVAFRSFDRHWALLDSRVGDYLRPALQRTHSDRQIYLTSLLTDVLGEGPAATVTALIPDLHHFRGSFGGRNVIPLWQDIAATKPNVTEGVSGVMEAEYGETVTPEDLFAYSYAVLATPAYVREFWDELTIPGPRIPLTKDRTLFEAAVSLGRKLIWLHTFGERFLPVGIKVGKVPQGIARCKVGTPANPSDYPEEFSYDRPAQELHVGKGVFDHVRPEVWDFSVSGLEVVKSWLDYRKRKRAGKSSSPLDSVRPESWQFDEELLDLLWVLDGTVDLIPEVTKTLSQIIHSPLFQDADLPKPNKAEREGPLTGSSKQLSLEEANDEEANIS